MAGSTISGYQLFRGVNSGSIALYQTLGNVLSYTDTDVSNGNTYSYYVVAVPVVGINSNPSNTVVESLGVNLVLVAGLVGIPCCPCAPASWGYGNGDVTAGFGSCTPTSVLGHVLAALSSTAGLVNLLIEDFLPANFFTTMTVHDSLIGSVVYAFASTISQGQQPGPPNYTFWQWSEASPLFTEGGTYHITLA